MRIILLALFIACFPLITNAAEKPLVIEVFTYPGCIPLDRSTINPDGTAKEPTETDKKFNRKHVGNIFEEIISEHPNAIALHYFNDYGYHEHGEDGNHKKDENGNEIIFETISEGLSNFIIQKSYKIYSNQSFLDEKTTAQMLINGTYKSKGTMKHVVDAAILKSQKEHNIKPAKLAIKGQLIEIELPEHAGAKGVKPLLIGYQKKQEIKPNKAVPAINPTNIVTSYKELETWNGEARSQTISIENMPANGFALIAQHEYKEEIYTAGKVEITD